MAEYDFEWEHKPGRHNQIADALCRHCVLAIVFSIVQVESDMLERLHQAAEEDATFTMMVDLVREGTI